MKYFIFISILISSLCFSEETCELTDEYKALRIEVGKTIFGDDNSYKQCINSAHKNEYWKAISICENKGDGKNIGGGCAHLVSNGKYTKKSDISHCKIFHFEPTPELAIKLMAEETEYKKIPKCK